MAEDWKTNMTKASSTPILNTSLPSCFRRIRLELAREPGHPEGEWNVAYIMVAPLDDEGRIDPDQWKKHRDACRVARLRPNEPESRGHLVHRPGGSWAFQYDISGEARSDESGYHFQDERFVLDEYVSIKDGGKMRTFRVVGVSHL
jgi:hypothetical protein